jgi:hypothetical protein
MNALTGNAQNQAMRSIHRPVRQPFDKSSVLIIRTFISYLKSLNLKGLPGKPDSPFFIFQIAQQAC